MSCTYNFSTTVSEIVNNTVVGCSLDLSTIVIETRSRMAAFSFEAGVDGTEIIAGTWEFELDTTPIANSVQVNIEGIPQNYTEGDFSYSGTTLTVPNIETGDKVYGFYEY